MKVTVKGKINYPCDDGNIEIEFEGEELKGERIRTDDIQSEVDKIKALIDVGIKI